MTHRDAYRIVLRDLTATYALKDMDQLHDHAVRLLKENYPHDFIYQVIKRDHGVKPQIAAVILAAAIAALEHGDDPPT